MAILGRSFPGSLYRIPNLYRSCLQTNSGFSRGNYQRIAPLGDGRHGRVARSRKANRNLLDRELHWSRDGATLRLSRRSRGIISWRWVDDSCSFRSRLWVHRRGPDEPEFGRLANDLLGVDSCWSARFGGYDLRILTTVHPSGTKGVARVRLPVRREPVGRIFPLVQGNGSSGNLQGGSNPTRSSPARSHRLGDLARRKSESPGDPDPCHRPGNDRHRRAIIPQRAYTRRILALALATERAIRRRQNIPNAQILLF